MQNNKVVEQIQKETQRVKNINNYNSKENIENFLRILTYPLNKPELKLDGLESRVPHSIEKVLTEINSKKDIQFFFPDFARVEPFIRKVFFLVVSVGKTRYEPGRA